MSSQKHIQDELKALESGLPFNNSQPFSVPEGYFEGFAASVLEKVKSSEVSVEAELGELSPLLAGIPKVTPYSVPFSYFEDNLEQPVGLIEDQESAVLNYIGKELPYTVPYGYFESFPEEILEKVSQRKAKVVPLFARTWMRVASAAVISGALFFAGLKLFGSKEVPPTTAKNDANTTQNQVAQNNQPVIKEIKQASTKELEDFVETVQASASNSNDIVSNKSEVEDLLKDVPTNEMETFLSDLSTSDDDLSLTD